MASTLTTSGEDALQEIHYFHGFLPRDDLCYLLKRKGDYLIRCSDVEHKGQKESREYIISCLAGDKRKKSMNFHQLPAGVDIPPTEMNIRHLVLFKNEHKWWLNTHPRFDTIPALTEHYKSNDFLCRGGTVVRLYQPVTRAKWEILHGDIELGKHLGKGEFGEVRVGKFKRRNGKVVNVAVKLTKGVSELSKAKRNQMMAEARVMRSIKHTNVVRLYGIGVLQQPLYIVLELVDLGGMDSYLHKNKLSDEIKNGFILDAAAGVAYIHSKKIIHRDLAARNCLLTSSSTRPIAKISDFGLSKVGDSYTLRTACKVPIKWCAPETIKSFVFSTKSDVWSFGVVCYEIYSDGGEPWDKKTNGEVKSLLIAGQTMALPSKMNEKLKSYIKESIWAMDPDKRPPMTECARYIEEYTKVKRVEVKDAESSVVQDPLSIALPRLMELTQMFSPTAKKNDDGEGNTNTVSRCPEVKNKSRSDSVLERGPEIEAAEGEGKNNSLERKTSLLKIFTVKKHAEEGPSQPMPRQRKSKMGLRVSKSHVTGDTKKEAEE